MDSLRYIDSSDITEKVCKAFIEANTYISDKVRNDIEKARTCETETTAGAVLEMIESNFDIASDKNIPICQDTGMAVVFVRIGKNIHVSGSSLTEAVNEGVRKAYVDGKLRLSVVRDPLFERVNTNDNTPAIIHTEMVPGEEFADHMEVTVIPKGFGSENMSSLKMFTPSATEEDITGFVIDSVLRAGSNPCPPIYVGIGIGGDFEYSAYLAKKALLRDCANPDKRYADMEKKILDRINETGIGPQGFGGVTTALGVMIETAPTHIAGLPVAVNINCHVSRHKTIRF